jgi:hypothetical protein
MRTLYGSILLALTMTGAPATDGRVQLERIPGGGFQPQAVADGAGLTHVIYFKGTASSGDLYYVRRAANGTYSTPLRVNSQPGAAIATGTVRGGQVALGRGNRVHVIWNGSSTARPQMPGGLPLLYSRLAAGGDAFEPQRNLITWSGAVDGGGTLAADDTGRVFVAWHANPGTGGDARAAVYLTQSDDDGTRFARERRISQEALGACACCSMRALVDRAGSLHLLYRAAGNNVDRDMTLLTSKDGGATFATTRLHPWKLEACPLSTAALAQGPNGVTAAWETAGQIYFARVAPGTAAVSPDAAPGTSPMRKHPVMAYNGRGEALLVWLDGTAWARGGSVAWQMYDASGVPTIERGTAAGVPVWGLAAAAPLPDGRFLILY